MTSNRLSMDGILPLFAAALLGGALGAETLTLQQPTTRTIVDTRPATEPDDGFFHLHGARNSLHVRFEIPKREGAPARARLMVFLPAARNPNKFTEIFCHEAITGGRQISHDETTDYDNGRRQGAVDSVELFAPPHEGWPHFPFLPLGVPEGGRWIEFNITQLVEKWLRGDAPNHGVLLIPANPPDGTASTWEIDVPAATHPQTAVRPKLVLEYSQDAALVAMTDPLVRIRDRSTRFGYRGAYRTSYAMSMAADEFEGFQIVVYPMLRDLRSFRVSFSDLVSDSGARIPASDIRYFLEDSYPLRRNWMTRELMFAGKIYDVTDPLVPARPADIRRHAHTPFYVTVRTRPETPAGVYRGKIRLTAENATRLPELGLEVKVWPYAIPKRWNFHTMGHFIWSNVERFHGAEADEALFRRYYDFLLEHRFSPTEQYRPVLSPRMNLAECLRRGMNTVYLNGNFDGSPGHMEQLRQAYETVKRTGALDYALVYIGDETDKWDEMRRRADLIHADLPGAMVMIGGSVPREELLGYIDIYDPHLSGGSKVYSLEQEAAHLVAESQQRGEEFYWYVAAGPSYPYPNVQLENPLIASRVLFWMTWKYGITGFEYYCYNLWERNYDGDPARRYPNVPWKADGWSEGWPTNGDGILFYPGPISSLRFEAIRDGIEDWESLMVLRDHVEALRRSKAVERYQGLPARAEAMLRVNDEVVAGFKDYTQDPTRLLAEREALGNLITEFVRAVPPGAAEEAARARIVRQAGLRRRMLRERHAEACRRLEVQPATGEEWDALWKRDERR